MSDASLQWRAEGEPAYRWSSQSRVWATRTPGESGARCGGLLVWERFGRNGVAHPEAKAGL